MKKAIYLLNILSDSDKAIRFFLTVGIFFSLYSLQAQTLNQSASWPNTNWSVNGVYDVNSVVNDPTASANFSYDDDNAGTGSTDSINAESPTIDLTAANTAGESWIKVEYNYNFNNGDSLQLQYYDAALAEWILWEDLADNSSTSSSWCSNLPSTKSNSPALDISTFTATQLSNFKYRFSYNASGVWGYGFCMDSPRIYSLFPITCIAPSNLTSSNVSYSSVELGWTENNSASQWQIHYDTAGFPMGTGDSVIAGTNPFTLTNLNGSTDYEFYVRSICSAGDSSSWAGPYSFTTECDPYTPAYSYDFTGYLDECWSEATGRLNFVTTLNYGTSNWTEDGFGNVGTTNAAKVNIYGTSRDEWLISPSIDLGTGTTDFQVEFDIILTNYNSTAGDLMGADDSLAVVVSTDNGATWSTANILKVWVDGNQPLNRRQYVELSLAAYTGVVKIGFYAASTVSNTDYDISIDNFSVDTLNSCPFPTDLAIDNITPTSADLDWTENGTASMWQIEYGTSGFTRGAGTFSILNAKPNSLTNLTPQTDYEIYIRSVCTAGDSSLWHGPVYFTTPCDKFIPEYNFDFTGYIDDCWSEATGRLNTNTAVTYGSSNWIQDGFGNVTTTNAARVNISGTSTDEWLISPSIDLGAGTTDFQVEFDIILTNSGSTASDLMGVDDSLAVVVSTDNGTTWSTSNIVQTWVDGNQPLNTRQYVELSIAGYTGVVKIGFYAASSITNTNYDISIDNFSVDTLSTCPFPSSLLIDSITATTANIDWTENGSASMWQIEYGTSGFTRGAGTFSILNAKPNSLSNLVPQTDYDIYIRSICGAGDSSLWFGPVRFSTPCDSYVPEYSFDFTGYIDDCWSEATGRLNVNTSLTYGSSNWLEDGFGNVGTTNAAKINIYGTTREEWLISPSIDLGTGATDFQVEFDIILTNYNSTANDLMGYDDSLAVVVSTDNGLSWSNANILKTWQVGDQPQNSRQYVELSLAGYTSEVRIGFYAASTVSNTDYDISIDNFSVDTLSTCPFPTALSSKNPTSSTMDISWLESGTATSWQIEFDTLGFTLGSGNDSIVNVDTVHLSGLNPNTTYQFYVRAICSPGDSSLWAGPFNFTTECGAVSAFPYLENFDGGLRNDVWECWEVLDLDGGNTWSQSSTYISPTHSTPYAAHGMGNNNDHLISPQFTLLSSDMRLILWDKVESATYNNTYHVLVSTTGKDTSDFTDTLATFNVTNTSWTERIVDLSTYSGQNIYISLYQDYSAATNYGFGIDDFLIEETPNCVEPPVLYARNLNPTTADLSWDSSLSVSEWQVEYGVANFSLGSGIDTVTLWNPTTITGLTPNTAYEFYVRSICGRDSSTWEGPFYFETPCAYVTSYPYLQPFNTFVPDCWEEASDGDPINGPSNLGAGSWTADDFVNNTTNGRAAKINLYSTINRDWIISEYFDLSSGGPYEIKLQAGLTDWGNTSTENMGSDDSVKVLISPNNGITWDVLYTWSLSNQPTNLGEYYLIDLSAYSGGQNTFAIWASDGSTNDPEDYDFFIDNFEIREIPTCREPSNLSLLSLTDSSANISWIENNTATTWEIQYGTSGFTLGAGIDTIVGSNPFLLTGLNGNTAYEYYVRSICGSADSSLWTGPFYFETPCSAVGAPYYEDFENAGTIPDCWNQGSSNMENWIFATTGGHVGNAGSFSASRKSNGYFAYVDDSTPDNTGTTLETPFIDLGSMKNPALSFYLISNNEGNSNVDFKVDVWNGTSWNNVYLNNSNTINGDWEEIIIDLNALSITGPMQVRFVVDEVISGDFYDDVAIDDIYIYDKPEIDASLVKIISPESACGLGANENVQIAVVNQGLNQITSIDLSYSIDGQTPITEQYTDTILAGDTLFYTFDSTANLSLVGAHSISSFISLLNDTLANNDSLSVEVIHIPIISTFPHTQSFENGNEGWVSGGVLNSWELGQPNNTIIDTAYHGTNAWVTSLSGTYNNNENSYVLSPCFDFTNMLVPQISMHVWWNSEFSWDGANLQASIDGGLTWNNVGQFGDPDNWYNDNSINGAPGGTQEGWTGRNSSSNGSGGWLKAVHALNALAGESSVRLRINFGSDGSAVDEGFAFDNIIIRETPETDAIASILVSPTNGCGLTNADTVKFMLINNGVQGIYNFDIGYALDTNATVIETYLDTVAAGDTLIYIFQTPADFSAIRDYNVMTYVNLINDMDSTNDTTYTIVTSVPTISGFPYFESFENGNGGWTTAGDLSSWELGTPANAIINSAANGNNSWVTSLQGTYNNDEDSYVISPCMDFTNLLAPEIRMAVWWNSEFSWDGANLQYSIDNGLNWNNVGAFGDPNNWYTDNSINGAPGGNQEGWTGRNSSSNGSNGWLIASNSLSSLAGEPSVRLRVNFGSDGSLNDEGFAFDDIIIGDPITLDARALKLIDGKIDYCLNNFSPVISIENLGSTTLNSVKIVSNINGALDTILYTTTMSTNQIDTVSLTNYNLVPGLNNVIFYTLDPNGSQDQLSANDSLKLIIDLKGISGGTIIGTDSICGSEDVNLELIGSIGNVQWQRLVGNTFVNESSAVGEYYQVLVDSTTSFRAIVCGTAVSDTFTVFSNIVSPPTVVNDTAFIICGDSGTVNLSASSLNSSHIFNWYESASSTAKVHTGNLYTYGINTTKQVITTNYADTFYVSAVEGGGGSVDTLTIEPFTGTNGCSGGNMFDVIPLANVSIEGFTINSNTIGSQTVDVYMKQGSYLGSQTVSADWTLVESVSVSGNGGGTASILSLSNTIDINSGDTVGIYIDYDAAYTNVTTGTVYSNSDLQVVVGDGLCSSFGGVNTGRAFNGQILYTTGCESVRVPVIGNVQCEAMTDLALFEFVKPVASTECYSTAEDLEIRIVNSGGKSIDFSVDTLNISINISGEISQLLTLQLNNNSLNNGSPLAFEDSIVLNMGSFDMSSSGIYNFEAILQMDNDLLAANDSLRTSVSNNTSAGSITVVDSICGSDFVTMNTSGSVGDLQWQRMVSGTFSDEIGADSSSYEVFVDSTTTFRLLACGTEVSDTFTVVSIEVPLAPTTSNDSVSIMCGISGEAILTASAGSSSKFNWYDAATGGTLVATGDSLIHNFSTSTQSPAQHYADTFYVAEISFGCEGPRAMAIADITIMTPDAPTAVSDTAIVFCGDTGTAILSASSTIAGSSFKWYSDPNGSNLLSSTDTLLYVLATTKQTVTTEYTDTFYVLAIDPVTNCESPMTLVSGTVYCTVGEEEMPQQLDMISIMPNPSKGIFHLLGSNVEDEMLVSILNMNGQIVYELDNKLSKHFNQRIDVSHLNKGVYFVKFQGKTTMEIRKIIIQ